jgi:hypothetical protein
MNEDNQETPPDDTQASARTDPAANDGREADGKWLPGKSGNTKGRPPMVKTVRDVRDLARNHTTAAIETLAKVMHNPKAPPACRVAASEALLARGWGRSPSGEMEGAEQLVIKVLRFAEQPIDNIKVIEGEVENG